jgi:hypothetical protein
MANSSKFSISVWASSCRVGNPLALSLRSDATQRVGALPPRRRFNIKPANFGAWLRTNSPGLG